MSLLARVQRGITPKPPRILVYGTEGVGKTTLGSQRPHSIFVLTEDGLDPIAADKFPLATIYDEVLATLGELRTQPHDYETFVLDSLDWLERLICDALCRQYGVSSIEKVDGGYVHALSFWREIIDHLNALRHERGMMIFLIAHSEVERFEDTESSPYDRYSPRLNKHAADLVREWCCSPRGMPTPIC
ncbi:MAG: ATP-binding protein [Gemmatales bacterium]|nr:ATP-binding protein [Gemmatales bacterium]MDW7995275.1 ATP-binding protein [Gemmatales bacterium]